MSADREQKPTAPPWAFLNNAYVQLSIAALLGTTAELLLRRGASSTGSVPWLPGWIGIGALASGWTWLGIGFYVLNFLCWLNVLRMMPLSKAFALISIVQVLVPLGAWIFLHESVNARRWLGIALTLAGIALAAKPAARIEEQL